MLPWALLVAFNLQEPLGAKPSPADVSEPVVDLRAGARVMTGFEVEHRTDTPDARPQTTAEVFLRQARVKARAEVGDWLDLKISADLADVFRNRPIPYLRDAWAGIKIRRHFRLKIGHFKRPFSRLELRRINNVPFRGRGLFNDVAIEDLEWGDRALAAMVWGRGKRDPTLGRITWKASGSTPDVAAEAVDGHARIVWEPRRTLAFGTNGSVKNVTDPTGSRTTVGAAGGDIRVRTRGWYAAVEANAAQDWRVVPDRPWMFSVVSYLTYDARVGKGFVIQPIAAAEWADSNDEYLESEAVRVISGVNVLWRDHLRILPQVDLVLPVGRLSTFNPWDHRTTFFIMVSASI